MLILSNNCYAGSTKEEYELQERCAKSAAEAFKTYKYGNEGIPEVYTCHYSKKLNKCFIMITAVSSDSEVRYVYDVNENKRYGGFTRWPNTLGVSCEVLGRECHSSSEWDLLIKPFMED
jgi:hypothetical protein